MGWFSSACPVDDETRDWIDSSFRWLIDELGLDVLRSVEVVLPTEEFFPDAFDGSRSSIRTMLNRVCEYMDVDPKMIEVSFDKANSHIHPLTADGEFRSHALGTYQMGGNGKYQISLEELQAANPEQLVATIAHELGHVILLGENRLDPAHPDHEPLTDLVTVFYGLGVFNANAAVIFEQWTNPQFQGWQIGRSGYLTEEIYGYALALFAKLRNETSPGWASHLTTNVRSYFKDATKFINKSGCPLVETVNQSSH